MRRALVRGLGLVLVTGAGVVPLAAQEGPARRVSPARVDFDLHEIRNIFRFGDEPARGSPAAPATDAAPDADRPASSGPDGPRLVGLIRRSDRLIAALAVEGEVILLSKGQSASGFTITEISEEGIHLRGPEGDESALRLP